MSDDPLVRSAAWHGLSPAARRLFECVDQQLAGRDRVAVSRGTFQQLAKLSPVSVTSATRQVTALGLLAVSAGFRRTNVYSRSTAWTALDSADVAERRAQLPRRRPGRRVKVPMRWPE
jgi:hypothetical protein